MSLVVGIRIPYVLHIIILPSQKENGLPRRFAPRDGGIPRFIDLPPSPFRGNDRGILAGYAVFGSSTKYENGRMLSLLLWRHCVKGGGQIII